MEQSEISQAIALINVHRFAEVSALTDRALKSDPKDIAALLVHSKMLRAQSRHAEALSHIEKHRELFEDSGIRAMVGEFHFERGYSLIATGRFEESLAALHKAIEFGEAKVDYYGGICTALCQLERYDEAVEWRHKILRYHDARVKCAPQDVVRSQRPKAFNPNEPSRNIVSYCLFGEDPFYHECAITNARVHGTIFPEFTARFFCAPDLPEKVLAELRAADAQVLIAKSPGGASQSPMAGTMWRFLSFDDPNVDVVISRDVDSPVLPRERAAIDMWLASDEPFFCMRDHAIHAELILAGMWGGFTGVLPPLGPLASRSIKGDHSKFADQRFLRTVIWPRLREGAIMQIDDFHSLEGSVGFPEGYPKHGRMHVGVSWTRGQILPGEN